ncbi:MAG: adenosylcobalamin-dependent ribonucleoside-diphosphate reductase [Blautia sp.]|jgi:ribonucleoside-diphosphate reductase alpha chain
MTVQEWLGEDNKLGIDIWERKYRYNDESFDEWLDRVSGKNAEVMQLIKEKKFLFGGRILSNRGLSEKGRKVSMSNCYVMAPPEDSIESIFDCAKKLARTYSYGGGCGVDISNLAPRGARVNNAAKETSGAVSFMELYSLVTAMIGQNGRRGALMLSLSCEHPDIEEFIEVKSDLDRVTKANLSIRITNEFMKAVKNKQPFTLKFTRKETGETFTKVVDAAGLFHKICKMNWDYAEPGMLFWDQIKGWNLLSCDAGFSYAGVNPCAEEPLPAGGSCLLGSINLSEFVAANKRFDFSSFKQAVHVSVKALNEVLDEGLPLHPLKEQRDSVRNWHQIGLGIFGLADMLIKMHIRYGGKESLDLCHRIGYTMIDEAVRTSAEIARRLGPYPAYVPGVVEKSAFYHRNVRDDTKKLVKRYGLYNSQLLTAAPTGTISSMLGVSGGIEPVYANSYTRKTESLYGHDEYYKVYPPIVKEYMEDHGLEDEFELPDFFVTAQTLDYHDRIDMQAVWQEHIDASISSTVNVPREFTVENTENLYLYAWEKGLKGVTIFRDGCRRKGVLTLSGSSDKLENKDTGEDELPRGYIITADDNVVGLKRKIMSGCGSLHVVAMFDPITGDLLETYLSKGSTGGCQSNLAAVSRLISLSVRAGVDIYTLADQLQSCMACPSYVGRTMTKHDTSKGKCCPDAVAHALIEMYREMKTSIGDDEALNNGQYYEKRRKQNMITHSFVTNPCPVCGNELVFEGGCNVCKECGWSKCD